MTDWHPTETTSRLQAVVFDLDGILANTEDLYEKACETVLGRRGRTYDAPLREQMMGRPVADALRIMLDHHGFDDPLEAMMEECREVLGGLMETSLAPMPGVHELLDDLEAAGLPKAVATSALREYADFVLSHLGLKQRFKFILTSEDIRCGKPDPEIYLLAAAQLALPATEILVLEDSANGCRAAVTAGTFTVAVPNRHTLNHNFSGARFIADTLTDRRIRTALAIER